MADVARLRDQLPAVDRHVVPVRPMGTVGPGRLGGDGSAVVVGGDAGEPGPATADPLDDVRVRVPERRQLEELLVGPPSATVSHPASGARVHQLDGVEVVVGIGVVMQPYQAAVGGAGGGG